MAKAIVAGVAAVTGSRLFRKHLLAFLGPSSAAHLGTATLPRRRPRAAGPVPDAELAQDKQHHQAGNISLTYTISFAIGANKLERYTK
jgi:hypothetical protein